MTSWFSVMANGTLTNQLKGWPLGSPSWFDQDDIEEKEFDLFCTQQEAPVKKKRVNVVKRASGRGPQARLISEQRYEEVGE